MVRGEPLAVKVVFGAGLPLLLLFVLERNPSGGLAQLCPASAGLPAA